jgi:Interleukin-like EMT inducer
MCNVLFASSFISITVSLDCHHYLISEACLVETLAWGVVDTLVSEYGYISVNKVFLLKSIWADQLTRGFNTVELILSNCSAGVIRHFDTCGSSSESDALAKYISGLPSWTILIGITADDAYWSLTSAAKTALLNIGVDTTHLMYRGKLSFVAQVGRPSGTVMSVKPAEGEPLKCNTTVSRMYPTLFIDSNFDTKLAPSN